MRFVIGLIFILSPCLSWASATTSRQLDSIKNSSGGSSLSVPSTGTTFSTDTNSLTLTNKTMSGASNTFSAIPPTAVAGMVLDYGDGSDGAVTLNGTNTYAFMQLYTQYTFTITAAQAYAGDSFTNNGHTFIVKTTETSGTSLVTYGNGAPTASGTLTYNAGTNQSATSITYSANSHVTTTSIYIGLKNLFLTNMTINSGSTFNPNGYWIYGNGTLTVNSGGIIDASGCNGLVGGIYQGAASQGASGQPCYTYVGSSAINSSLPGWISAISAPPTMGQGGISQLGAVGTMASAGTQGNPGGLNAGNPIYTNTTSGDGGAGGSGTSGAGGPTDSAPTAGSNAAFAVRNVQPTLNGINGGVSGSSGSSGGGDAVYAGGGGGSSGGGGGLIEIHFATVTNSGTIQAKGGNGGNGETPPSVSTGVGGGGGGGGGQGGSIYIISNTITNGTMTVTGGSAGTHGNGSGTGTNGANGTAGGAGIILRYQASTGTWI